MKIVLVTVQSQKNEWAELAAAEFAEKIRHYFSGFEPKVISSKKLARSEQQQKVEMESELILDYLENSDYVVLFDEKGKVLTSIEFAKKLENWLSLGKKRLVFVIGGAFGVSQGLKERANLTVSLSSMVMNHLVAKLVALEQIYRAFSIKAGRPYHNE